MVRIMSTAPFHERRRTHAGENFEIREIIGRGVLRYTNFRV